MHGVQSHGTFDDNYEMKDNCTEYIIVLTLINQRFEYLKYIQKPSGA